MPSDSDRAIALLRYANYQKVGDALLVSRAAVADWAKGKCPPYRVNQLEQLLRPDLQIEEAAPPTWAERLLESLFVWEHRAEVTDEELVEAQARVAAFLAVAHRKRQPPASSSGGGGAAS